MANFIFCAVLVLGSLLHKVDLIDLFLQCEDDNLQVKWMTLLPIPV